MMARVIIDKNFGRTLFKIGMVLLIILVNQHIVFSQVADTALMQVHYVSSSKLYPDSKQSKQDWHCLDIGKNHSKFYSMNTLLLDSTKNSLIAAGLSIEQILLKIRGMNQGSEDIITKDYVNSSLSFVSTILTQDYFYQEPLETADWELLQDTLTILGYNCYKAQREFRGRTWEAWYAPDIPSMDGPWKLAGLPGLILKAKDSANEFTFECNGISLLTKLVVIENPLLLKSGRIIKTDGRSYTQIKRKSIEDLRSSIAAKGFTIVSVVDENGMAAEIPKLKMNSIEEYN